MERRDFLKTAACVAVAPVLPIGDSVPQEACKVHLVSNPDDHGCYYVLFRNDAGEVWDESRKAFGPWGLGGRGDYAIRMCEDLEITGRFHVDKPNHPRVIAQIFA